MVDIVVRDSALPAVTVMVLTRDRPDRCARCVRETLVSLEETPGDILVVDNGGNTDIPLADPSRCRVLVLRRNFGPAARNMAMSFVTNPVVLMLDDDATIGKQAIRRMLEIIASSPDVGAVTFRVKNNRHEEGCLLPTVFHGCACGFRVSAIREAGGYPEWNDYYGEEYDVAFRLYSRGYRIIRLEETVTHHRDSRGRNINRIIRNCIRNNSRLWASSFPRNFVGPALKDTLDRYRLVARKENAWRGYLTGIAGMPWAVAEGLRSRHLISDSVFSRIILMQQLEREGRLLIERGYRRVILCGAGKFPSIWVRCLRSIGLVVDAVWDFNPCWNGGTADGVPCVVQDIDDTSGIFIPHSGNGPCSFLLGTSSLPETAIWTSTLRNLKCAPLEPATGGANPSPAEEIDLLNGQIVRAWATI